MGRAWGIPGVLSLHHFVGYNRGFQLDAILAKMKSRISWTEILALGQELLGLSGTIKYSRWFWVNKIHLSCFSLSPWSLESPSKLTHEGIREQTVLTHKSTSCEPETAREPWGVWSGKCQRNDQSAFFSDSLWLEHLGLLSRMLNCNPSWPNGGT